MTLRKFCFIVFNDFHFDVKINNTRLEKKAFVVSVYGKINVNPKAVSMVTAIESNSNTVVFVVNKLTNPVFHKMNDFNRCNKISGVYCLNKGIGNLKIT